MVPGVAERGHRPLNNTVPKVDSQAARTRPIIHSNRAFIFCRFPVNPALVCSARDSTFKSTGTATLRHQEKDSKRLNQK